MAPFPLGPQEGTLKTLNGHHPALENSSLSYERWFNGAKTRDLFPSPCKYLLRVCCARTFAGRQTGPTSRMGINREASKKPALWAEEAETGHLNHPLSRGRRRESLGERVRRRARPCEGQSTRPGSGCRAGAPESLCSVRAGGLHRPQGQLSSHPSSRPGTHSLRGVTLF